MSGIVNKVKEALSSDKHSSHEGTHAAHESNMTTTANPGVDSTREYQAPGRVAGHGEYGSGVPATSGAMGTTGLGSSSAGYGEARQGEVGPHNSRIANTMDPRVDSDLDGSRTVGGNTGTTGYAGNTTTGATGLGSAGGAYGEARQGEVGPHNSRIANTMDPRVDSDLDGSRTVGGNTGAGGFNETAGATTGYAGTSSGVTSTHHAGAHGTHGTHGTHTHATHTHGAHAHGGVAGSHHGAQGAQAGGLGNATYEAEGRGVGFGGAAPGPAPNTAGPHKSDMLNKLDPRVDSNLDGSKTVGGDKTYQ